MKIQYTITNVRELIGKILVVQQEALQQTSIILLNKTYMTQEALMRSLRVRTS